MYDHPTVSVVIPSYNYGRFVRDAVESALAQSRKPLEIIVVDDGSTDDTRQVLQPYHDKGNIRYIYQKNSGLSAARNTGIQAAAGEWIAFLDADDVWFVDKLALQLQCAQMQRDACIIGAVESTHATAAVPNVKDANGESIPFTCLSTLDLLGAMPFGASSVMARRSALIEAGLFNEKRRSVEDREMWLKLTLLGSGARVNKPLWTYRIHPNQMNANPGRMSENYASVLDDFFVSNPKCAVHRSFAYGYYCYDSAIAHFDAGLNLKAFSFLVKSFLHHPLPLPQRHAERKFYRAAVLAKCVFGANIFNFLMKLSRIFRPGQARALRYSPGL